MGHRANYVVVEEGRRAIHYSQFGALSLAADPLMGPENLEFYIRGLEPRDELTDDVWCEGSIVLDKDARVLLFFSDHGPVAESIGFRRAYFALLSQDWVGWTIRWAPRGQAEIVDHLGIDPTGLIEQRSGSRTTMTAAELAAEVGVVEWVFKMPISAAEYRAMGVAPPFRTHAETVVTVRFVGGEVRDFSFSYEIDTVLSTGPELVAALADRSGQPMPNEYFAHDGAFIDVPARRITGWPTPSRRPVAAWPGWQLVWHDDGLPHQAELSGRDPAPVRLTRELLLSEGAELLGLTDREEATWDFLDGQIAQIQDAGAEAVHHASRPAPRQPRHGDSAKTVLARLAAHAVNGSPPPAAS